MKTFKVTSLIFCTLSILAFQCGKKNIANRCQGSICTQVFVEEKIEVVNTQQQAITPTSVIISNASNGQAIQTYTNNSGNVFTIFTDNDAFRIADTSSTFTAEVKVMQGNTITSTTLHQFKKDCCHVYKTSGNTTIVVP